MAALNRALALDERQHRAVVIAEQLHFDVARRHDAALEIDRAVAERATALRSARRAARPADPPATATMRMPLPPPPATAFSISG